MTDQTDMSDVAGLIAELREHNTRIERLLYKVVAQREQVGLVISKDAALICCFCRSPRHAVATMVTNEHGVAICGECVKECRATIDRQNKRQG